MTSPSSSSTQQSPTADEDAKIREIESYIRQHLLSITRLGTEEIPGRPPLEELKQRVNRAYYPEEAVLLLAYIEEREHDEDAFWKELYDFERECVARGEAYVEQPQPLDKGFHLLLKLLARAEVEQLVETRMRLRAKKQWERENDRKRVNFYDAKDHAERTLEMIECLPQGSRGTKPPREGFLNLGKQVAGPDAEPKKQLLYALLLEEYALELLHQHMGEETSPSDNMSWYAIPPSLQYMRDIINCGRAGAGDKQPLSLHENGHRYGSWCPPYAPQVRMMQDELGVSLGRPNSRRRETRKPASTAALAESAQSPDDIDADRNNGENDAKRHKPDDVDDESK